MGEDFGRFVEAGEQQNAIIGFFAVDDGNGIIGRNDTKSSYGIFREASTKNKDASFGIVKDKALAAKCGVTRMPLVLTVYYSDDKTRRLALIKKGATEADYKFVGLAPKRP